VPIVRARSPAVKDGPPHESLPDGAGADPRRVRSAGGARRKHGARHFAAHARRGGVRPARWRRGSGYWDLSSQPATFPSQIIRQHQVATDDTFPRQNPVQCRNRVVEAVKVGNPRPVHPKAPSSLTNHTAAPGPCPNLGRSQLDCDTAKESERQSEPARRRPAPESQLGPGRAFGRTSGPRLQTPSQSAQHTNLHNPTCTCPTDGTGGKLHRSGPTRDEYLVLHNQPCG
jgi:hypothetical protein